MILPSQIKGLRFQHSAQNADFLVLNVLQTFVSRGAARSSNERRLENGNIELRIIGSIHQLVFLLRKKPKQSSRRKGEARAIDNVGDGSLNNKVYLELNMVMALEHLDIPSGFRQKQKAIVSLAKLEVREHLDNIR